MDGWDNLDYTLHFQAITVNDLVLARYFKIPLMYVFIFLIKLR